MDMAVHVELNRGAADPAGMLEALLAAQPPDGDAAGAILVLPTACDREQLVASLRDAVRALRAERRQQERRRQLPANVGKPWTPEQDAELLTSFDTGLALDDIAARLQRTRVGIRSRLERHGRLSPAATERDADG